jgi:ribonuclease BN (tRNA processing enzyme)
MRVTFIGSGDAFGNGGRFQTCFLLEHPGLDSVLIDCGATSLTALKAAGKEPNDVTTILLTHLHGDHFGGIPFLVLDGQFRRRERDLTIAGPPGTRKRVEQAMELLFPGSLEGRRRFELDFSEIEPGAPTGVGPANVTTIEVEQPGTPACALRVEYAGATVAYSGDTAWTDGLLALAQGADLFIAEAYFFDKQVAYHLDHATLKANEARLGCKRIVLTHMSPEMLARTHEAEFECARDGMVVELDPTKS